MAVFYLSVMGLLALDQATKYLAREFLSPVGHVFLVPHILELIYVENRGIAFGMLPEWRWVFVAICVVLLGLTFYFVWAKFPINNPLLVACTLVCAGGLGNLIDRVFRACVVDFIHISFFPPVFNIADIFVTVGAVYFLVYMVKIKNSQKRKIRW